jgi:hypothetical protein
VTCTVYAHEHGLLEEEGWKWFKGIAKCEKKMLRMVNQSRIKATRNAPRYSLSVYGDVKEIIPMDILEPKGKVHYPVPLLWCKLVSQHGYWKIRYYHPPLPQLNPDGLVLKETSYCWYCYFWFKIHYCKDYNQSDHWPPNDSLLCILAFLFEKRATSLETTRPLSTPHQPHMPSYTRDTTLYHSIMYKRQLLPSMLWSSICQANTILPTFSASTGLMLWYGEPWMPFYLLEEIHGIF